MKPQDLLFFVILLALLWKRNPKWLVAAGLTSIIFAIPLFTFWIFFTAERLAWYAVAFLLVGVVLQLSKIRNE